MRDYTTLKNKQITMITLTIQTLKVWFNEFNTEYFDGKLKTPNFQITNVKSFLGRYCSRGNIIQVSVAYIRSERDYKNTLLHEMCHQYDYETNGLIIKPHGARWKRIAAMVNSKMQGKYGIIQRCNGASDKVVIRNSKMSKFVVFTDYVGKMSIAKYNDDKYIDNLLKCGCVMKGTKITFYLSNDGTFAIYPMHRGTSRNLYWNYFFKECSFSAFEKTATKVKEEMYR